MCGFKKDLWTGWLFVPGIVKRWPVAKLFIQQLIDTECYLNQTFHPCFVWKCYSQEQHLPIFLFQDLQSVSEKECYRRIMGKHPSGWPGCLTSHARGSFSFLDCDWSSGPNICSVSYSLFTSVETDHFGDCCCNADKAYQITWELQTRFATTWC